MRSMLYCFFRDWGVQIKESWKVILAILFFYMGVEMLVLYDSYSLMFQEYGFLTTLYGILVVLGTYMLVILFTGTFILTIVRTVVRRKRAHE
jgi:hypothetical protein